MIVEKLLIAGCIQAFLNVANFALSVPAERCPNYDSSSALVSLGKNHVFVSQIVPVLRKTMRTIEVGLFLVKTDHLFLLLFSCHVIFSKLNSPGFVTVGERWRSLFLIEVHRAKSFYHSIYGPA